MNTFRTLVGQLRTRIAPYRGAALEKLAADAKVSPRWLQLFREGKATNATVNSLDKLNNTLLRRDRRATRQ